MTSPMTQNSVRAPTFRPGTCGSAMSLFPFCGSDISLFWPVSAGCSDLVFCSGCVAILVSFSANIWIRCVPVGGLVAEDLREVLGLLAHLVVHLVAQDRRLAVDLLSRAHDVAQRPVLLRDAPR